MPYPIDQRLYNRVKEEAKTRFKRWPSAYGSAWLVKEYKRRGGQYEPSGIRDRGVGRWMKEEWIQVVPYIEKGVRVPCGSRKEAAKACRPYKRISEDTPITLDELLSLHGRTRVLQLAKKKLRNMDGRVNWKAGKFTELRAAAPKVGTTRV